MAKKKYARDPMLYIQQPDNKHPRASMQYSYRTKKNSFASENGIYSRSRSFFDEEREARQNEENVELEEDESDEEKEDNPAEENKRKQFNERTLEEKIKYFADTPDYVPRKKCEIKTEHKTYRGIIAEKDEEHVFIRVGNRARTVKIAINEIKNIKLLGFSKN
ncbi:CotO family spore coat protein [Virgibacillus oceani]